MFLRIGFKIRNKCLFIPVTSTTGNIRKQTSGRRLTG